MGLHVRFCASRWAFIKRFGRHISLRGRSISVKTVICTNHYTRATVSVLQLAALHQSMVAVALLQAELT
jgi:hypothetical protein